MITSRIRGYSIVGMIGVFMFGVLAPFATANCYAQDSDKSFNSASLYQSTPIVMGVNFVSAKSSTGSPSPSECATCSLDWESVTTHRTPNTLSRDSINISTPKSFGNFDVYSPSLDSTQNGLPAPPTSVLSNSPIPFLALRI